MEANETPIEKEMQNSYIDYAMSVIVGRALPDARDGLKPVQRRILFGMYKLNNVHNQPTKKSARIVGEVMGKYHPHGDMAIYDALVRMAQPFTVNHTLVEGQGNMGSIDGDPPAAQRYTEVRLAKIAEESLEDIEKNSVEMIPNFDNTEKEPNVLPSKIPNLLLNGSSGIAVGVATNILPHNLNEICDAIIAYIKDNNVTSEELLNYIKGPDFPTGGIVYYNNQLHSSYLTGRGSVTIRCRYEMEENKNKYSSIVIKEIPYNTNKAQIAEHIGELVKNKIITGISNIRDESDKEGIRFVIELKKDANPESILNTLYKHTHLQITVPVMNIAVLNNSLLTLNLRNFIKTFVEHRFKVITNRTRYDLNVAMERKHIVEGLIVAINDIDNVVNLIKKSIDSKNARAALIEKYTMSEKQANAILDMKLGRLTGLEAESLNTENLGLGTKIGQLNGILADNSKVYDIIKEETNYIKEHYGRSRRTVIERSELPLEISNEELIEDTETTIILTRNNYLKRLSSKSYKIQERGGRGMRTIELKEGDITKHTLSCKTKDTLFMISDKGRAYWIKAYNIPEGERYAVGKAAINIVNLREGEKIEKVVNTRDFSNSFIVFITRKGVVKRVMAEKFKKPRSTGVIAVPLKENDALADVCISDGSSYLFAATKLGKAIRFPEITIRPMSRIAHGIRGIRLKEKDEVVNILQAKDSDLIMTITEKGFGKITQLEKYRLQNRGGKGVLNMKINDKTGNVVKSIKVNDSDSVLLLNSKGISIQFPVSSVRKTGRAASGVRIMRLEEGSKVVDAQVMTGEEAQENETNEASVNSIGE
ncbi:DNA gyrase subunit A [Candidatus Marsarchaeota archaeon]|jgi:DNA gyrase subunit A|nr:DNA gyrase subunit A [Candidatus Marsarchaeota archaeon]MCL5089576.1 DNA gyrase subunit A [Candidatus Marsarchaeota archaeon]